MLFLNTLTGELKIDENCSFKINSNENDIKSTCNNYRIEVSEAGKESKYCTIHDIDDGEISLVSLFTKEKLQWVSISLGKNYSFPPFVITQEEKNIVKKKLNDMGGENSYQWGSVEFNEDIKGGLLSVFIKYTNESMPPLYQHL